MYTATCANVGVLDQHVDVVVVRLGLGEGVVEDDVDVLRPTGSLVSSSAIDDTVGIRIEEVGEADDDHVVVVNQHATQTGLRRGDTPPTLPPRGMYATARAGGAVAHTATGVGQRRPVPGAALYEARKRSTT